MRPWPTAELTVIKSRVCQTCEDQVQLASARVQPTCTLRSSRLSGRLCLLPPANQTAIFTVHGNCGTGMSVLVTGGAGYIGSHMVHALVEAGERVVVLDNLSTGRASLLPADVPIIVGGTGDPELVASIIESHRVEAILHFAASIVVSELISHPLDYYRNNTANSRTLLETAIAGGVRYFIFSSTAAVYGNPIQVPVSEDAVPAPLSSYGWSKLMPK